MGGVTSRAPDMTRGAGKRAQAHSLLLGLLSAFYGRT